MEKLNQNRTAILTQNQAIIASHITAIAIMVVHIYGLPVDMDPLLKLCNFHNIQVIEVPIKYEARSYQDGKKIKLKDGLKIFFKILKYCRINIFTKY